MQKSCEDATDDSADEDDRPKRQRHAPVHCKLTKEYLLFRDKGLSSNVQEGLR